MRLIDAELLKADVKRQVDMCVRLGMGEFAEILGDSLYKEVDKQPTVEAEPVRHGRWEDSSNGWMCSVCGKDSTRATDYCPHCGARMVGGIW